MNTPIFSSGQRANEATLMRGVEAQEPALVRVYSSVNVATTTAAKYNARFPTLTFNVARLAEDSTMYGVFARPAEGA